MTKPNTIDKQPNRSALPEVMTPGDVETYLGIPVRVQAQQRYLRQGFPFTKVGRRVYYLRTDVLAYLGAHRAEMRD